MKSELQIESVQWELWPRFRDRFYLQIEQLGRTLNKRNVVVPAMIDPRRLLTVNFFGEYLGISIAAGEFTQKTKTNESRGDDRKVVAPS